MSEGSGSEQREPRTSAEIVSDFFDSVRKSDASLGYRKKNEEAGLSLSFENRKIHVETPTVAELVDVAEEQEKLNKDIEDLLNIKPESIKSMSSLLADLKETGKYNRIIGSGNRSLRKEIRTQIREKISNGRLRSITFDVMNRYGLQTAINFLNTTHENLQK